MKKLVLLSLSLISALHTFGIDAYFNKAIMMSPDEGMYVETQMLFMASSLRYTPSDNGFQAQVELTYIFETTSGVADYSKNIVRSPYITDTVNALQDFIDVQRFFLAPNTYQLKIKLRDINNPIDTGSIVQEVLVKEPGQTPYFSDVIFIDTIYQNQGKTSIFSRGSVDMIPRISGIHGPDMSTVKFYTELYQTDFTLAAEEPYLINIDLLPLDQAEPIETYHVMKRMVASPVQPIFHSWDITSLRTGKYVVRIEARNRENNLIASRSIRMDRYGLMPSADSMDLQALSETFVGKIDSEDSLRSMLYCMRYKADHFEEKYINDQWENGDTVDLRRFFYEFWHDRNPVDPESAWERYHDEIQYVERNFGLGSRRRHACATDRGRTYLFYGKPDTRFVQRSEPSASPYEIWHYYKTPEKSNAKFVFYDPSLVTNDFVMLHSNVPGEQFDQAWYLQLSRPNVSPGGNDEPINTMGEVMDPNNLYGQEMNEVGFRALEYWNNPR